MKPSEDGSPKLGSSASTLGARAIDILADADGMVWPETGGMSVTPDDIRKMPYRMKPEAFGGGSRLTAYEIDSEDLGPLLRFRRDPKSPITHGFVEPARPTTYDEYHEAIQETAASWRKVT